MEDCECTAGGEEAEEFVCVCMGGYGHSPGSGEPCPQCGRKRDCCAVEGCEAPVTHGIHGMFDGELKSYSACAGHKDYWKGAA